MDEAQINERIIFLFFRRNFNVDEISYIFDKPVAYIRNLIMDEVANQKIIQALEADPSFELNYYSDLKRVS